MALNCTLRAVSQTSEVSNGIGESLHLPVRPDAEKKSVYWLDPPTATDAVMHTIIGSYGVTSYDCRLQQSNPGEVFYVGGFQLISNAKQVQVYLQRPGDNNDSQKDSYLTTVKGIKTNVISNTGKQQQQLFKAMCVIPGGPRPVTAVRLELQSLLHDNDDVPQLNLYQIRWTLRMPKYGVESTNTSTRMTPVVPLQHPLGMTSSLPHQSSPSSSSDESTVAAMSAGLAFAIQASEERILKQMAVTTELLQSQLTAATQTIATLTTKVHELKDLLWQQQHHHPTMPAQPPFCPTSRGGRHQSTHSINHGSYLVVNGDDDFDESLSSHDPQEVQPSSTSEHTQKDDESAYESIPTTAAMDTSNYDRLVNDHVVGNGDETDNASDS